MSETMTEIAINIPKHMRTTDVERVVILEGADAHRYLNTHQLKDRGFMQLRIQPGMGIFNAIDHIAEQAVAHGMNTVLYTMRRDAPVYDLMMMRTKERKKAGREYVGVGVGAVVRKRGSVLLLRRGEAAGNRIGEWDLSGGTVEPPKEDDPADGSHVLTYVRLHPWLPEPEDNSLEATVVREVFEETGLIVKPARCIGIYEDLPEGQHWINFAYVADIVDGTLENKEPHKCAGLQFFPMRKLPENTSGLTKDIITRYLRRKRYEIMTIRC
jgi:ADP-ribose pyrophosphatase YjhB (NUDIX family)